VERFIEYSGSSVRVPGGEFLWRQRHDGQQREKPAKTNCDPNLLTDEIVASLLSLKVINQKSRIYEGDPADIGL
jgi:hypothetical protein